MITIRLQRIGKKNQPSFRLVLTEKSAPPKGKVIEILGYYNPRLKTKSLKIERIKYWLSKGTQTSATVHNLLVSENVISGPKIKAWRPKKQKESQAVKTEKVVEKESAIEIPAAPEAKIIKAPAAEMKENANTE